MTTKDEVLAPDWKLVPVEPTEYQLAVGSNYGNPKEGYREMVKAAPQPPEPAEDVELSMLHAAEGAMIKDALAASPAPAEDVGALKTSREMWHAMASRLEGERDAAEAALAEAKAELEGAQREVTDMMWQRRRAEEHADRLTAERDRLAEAARGVLDFDLRDEGGRRACAKLAAVLVALASTRSPETDGEAG